MHIVVEIALKVLERLLCVSWQFIQCG